MQTHSQQGHTLLSHSRSRVHTLGAQLALEHHERWDGTGYPNGLSGNSISLHGRIAAVADVLDALVCASHYKPAWTLQAALDYIQAGSGKHFDPELVKLLNQQREAIEAIYTR